LRGDGAQKGKLLKKNKLCQEALHTFDIKKIISHLFEGGSLMPLQNKERLLAWNSR
jgi:hypothetical protein